MTLIKQVVQSTLKSGHLTHHVEERLRRLFDQGCDLEDIDALTQLQQAISCGTVKRFAATHHKELDGCRAGRQTVPSEVLN